MMKKIILFPLLLLSCLLCASACSRTGVSSSNTPTADLSLTGSTPGDSLIKSLLTIPPQTYVDFIRWDLTFSKGNTFVLNLNFGEGQPNTLGFKGGGEKLSFEGAYTVSQNKKGEAHRALYQLKSDNLPAGISLVKLNDNLFHLLTPEQQLMVGNGGWSYTLNRKQPIAASAVLPTLTASRVFLRDTARQLVFVGRTPCRDFAEAYNLPVPPNCIKLKWKLTLNRDPAMLRPTTYQLKRTDHRASDIEGTWTIIEGTSTNPDAIIYQLDPDQPEKTVSFLVGDDNVLFFLDRDHGLYVGNGDFSFTLNRM